MSVLDSLKENHLFNEVDAFLNKCSFIAEPGELFAISERYLLYLYCRSHSGFDRNVHVFVNFSGVLNGKYAWVPDGFTSADFMDYTSNDRVSFIEVTDIRLKSINLARHGRVSNELLKFFEDQLKIEKLTRIIET